MNPTTVLELSAAHAQGHTNQAIANHLGLSLSTVKRYKQRLGLGSNDARNTLGRQGEHLVAEVLTGLGLKVHVTPSGHPYDIQADGWRLEVKTSSTLVSGQYRFRLNSRRSSNHARYRYTKNYLFDSDFLLLAIVEDEVLQHLYCLPTAFGTPNLWVQPTSPFCPYAAYLGALHLLSAPSATAV